MNKKNIGIKKYNIGIDIGGSHIRLALVNALNIVDFEEVYILEKNKKDQEEIIKYINTNVFKLYNKILNKNLISSLNILKIGVAFPGIYQDGIIYNANNLNIKRYEILKDFKKIFKNKEIKISNDAEASLKAEMQKSLKNIQNGMFLSVGTGIGGKVIQDGKILNADNLELGHITFKLGGKKCSCGKDGCLEKYCSMRTLRENLKENIFKNIETKIKNNEEKIDFESKHLNLNKLDYEKADIKKIVDEYILNLAYALRTFSEIFKLEKIVIGGSFSEITNGYLLNKLKEEFRKLPKVSKLEDPEILNSYFENNSGIIGNLI